ncbi:MAG: hypothetical protein K8U57_23605 [Planctomycetes bacterium]|nr:hypothetical protein [Planctomycetota bacterium]
MSRNRLPFARAVFTPRYHVENLPTGSTIIDVSSYAPEPYCTLSPMWVHGDIPVPGMTGTTSDTVEGVWQGLKVIRGEIAPRYFHGHGAKRGGKPSGHRFGKKLLGIVEARRLIYIPTYEWMLTHCIASELLEGMIETALSGVTQYIHDVGDSGDINDANQPLAHAAVLVQYINRMCLTRNTRSRDD